MSDYEEYIKELTVYSDDINLKMAITSQRTGKKRFIDNFVFAKAAWSEALTYFAIIQSMVIFLGLMDDVIMNINSVLTDLWSVLGLGTAWQLPVNTSSYFAFAFILFIFCFGFIGYRHLGLPKRNHEIGASISPIYYMLWKKNKELEQKIEVMQSEKRK